MTALVIYGNIGAGKSSICDLLSERLNTIPVSLDQSRREIFTFHETENKMKLEQLSIQLTLDRLEGSPIIFETTAVTKFASRAINLLGAKGYKMTMIHLYCPPDICFARYQNRKRNGHFKAPFAWQKSGNSILNCIEHFDKKQREIYADMTFHSHKRQTTDIVDKIIAKVNHGK